MRELRFPTVYFDLDGTVFDSIGGIVSSMTHTLDHFGIDVPNTETMTSHIGPPLEAILATLGIPEAQVGDAVAVYREHYVSIGAFECNIFEGVRDCLIGLTERGITLATATSKSVDTVLAMLSYFSIDEYFSYVSAAPMNGIGADKLSVLTHAIEATAPHGPTALVGDRAVDVAAAIELGVAPVVVEWGYGTEGEFDEFDNVMFCRDTTQLGNYLLGR